MEKEEKNLQSHLVTIQNLLFIGAIVMIVALLLPNTAFFWIVGILGFLMMIASILYSARYYKCPHCKTKLDPRRKVPNFCPNCGKELN